MNRSARLHAGRSDTSQRILDAGTELFLRDGYGNTNLEQVAARAGVTKPTIYSHFGSKQGLLLAATHARATARADAMSSTLGHTGDPRADLLRFAEFFVSQIFSEESHRWQRLAHMEALDHPEVGESFFAAGPARVFQAVTDYLRREKRAGRVTCKNPETAADQFLGMLIGMTPIRLMGGQPLPSAKEQKKRSREAVNTFLAAFESH